ncbi:MAG TPA: LCP family protein [Acidimicrobiia bacterium]
MTPSKTPVQAFVRSFVVALVVVFAIVTGGLAYATWFYNNAVAKDPHHVEVSVDPTESGKPVNYLIVGSDSRSFVDTPQQAQQFGSASSQTGERSDTLIIAHLDPSKKQAYVVSFPRDLWVTFPGGCHAKINAAFNNAFHCEGNPDYGGPSQIIRVMQQDFGIPINHYLSVDFESFKGIVDAIGTVDLFIPTVARDVKTGLFVSTPGCNVFNGARALQYVRSRDYEYKTDYRQATWTPDGTGDLGRIRRQQYFIRSLAQAAIHKGMTNVSTAITIVHKALQSLTVESGFSSSDLSPLVDAFHSTDPGAIQMATIPADQGESTDGQSILNLNTVGAAPIFARLRNIAPPAPVEAPDIPTSSVVVDIANGNGVSGEAGQTLTQLANYGFGRGTIADAAHADTTQIRYAPGDGTKAQLVQAYLAGVGTLVSDSSLPNGTVRVVLGGDFGGVSAPASASHAANSTTTTTAQAPDPGHTAGVAAPQTQGQPLVGCG